MFEQECQYHIHDLAWPFISLSLIFYFIRPGQLPQYTLCFDNVNQKITARHRSTKRSNTSGTLNMFNTFATKSRVSVKGSARRPEPLEIRDIPITNLLPSKEDTINLEEEAVIIVGRIVKDQVSIFNKCDVQSINHEFMEESEHEVVQLNTPSTDKKKIFLPSVSGSSGGF